jgi:extracellular elastinolytic metalloproteinase
MLDMRNAILAADVADYAGADLNALWAVFAHRGMGFFASSQGGDDTAPVESFTLPPAPGSPTGTLSGVVTNSVGGGVLPGITIGVSGHDSGFPGDYVATSNSQGAYSITGLAPGTYPSVYASGGVDRVSRSLTISTGTNPVNWSVARDWASSAGGAKIVEAAALDPGTPECAPVGAIDQSATVGWSSPTSAGSSYLILQLPAPVDVAAFAINPSNICGDGRASALGDYRIETSVDGVTWLTAASGTFGSSSVGHLNSVAPAFGTDDAVRYLRLDLLSAQVDGASFVDLAELEVYGPQSAGLPRHNHQGGHPPIPH